MILSNICDDFSRAGGSQGKFTPIMISKTTIKHTSGSQKNERKFVRSPRHTPKQSIAKSSLQDKFIEYLPLALIVLVFFIIYNQALNFELIDWDDFGYIKQNPDIKDFNVRNFFTSFYGGNYHPLTCLSWAID